MAGRPAVIALPRQFAHWDTQLALFPSDIALVLGPLVARLSALMGGAPFDEAPEGLPDGFDGIAARGTYDHLLSSEWLLSEELPDEFLRRAVSGEHLFLQRAYQEESAAKQTAALFDAGADQLGAPRLAQLAILIAMAKRAGESGATLKWGIFQDESTVLRTGLTKALVRDLLRARSAQPVWPADIDRWMEDPEIRMSSEVWFVGAETLLKEAKARKALALIVSDVLEPVPPHRIHVRAISPGAARVREAVLDAPRGSDGARILRDPFGLDVGARVPSVHIDPQSTFVFSADGRKIFVTGEELTLVAIPIPNSPRAKVSQPHVYVPPAGHVILAVGQTRSRKRTVVLTEGEGALAVHTLSKRGGMARNTETLISSGEMPSDSASRRALRPLGVFKSTYCFIDGAGNLVDLTKDHTAVKNDVVALASRAAQNAFAYVARDGAGALSVVERSDKYLNFDGRGIKLPPMPEDAVYYFSAFGLSNLIAYSRQESRCILFHNLSVTEVEIPRSHSAAGMIYGGDREPMIVALHDSKLRVEVLRNGTWEVLFATSAPIARIAVSDAGSVVTYITEAGEVGIHSCVYHTMLLKIGAGTG